MLANIRSLEVFLAHAKWEISDNGVSPFTSADGRFVAGMLFFHGGMKKPPEFACLFHTNSPLRRKP
jgi:hypothetical protein